MNAASRRVQRVYLLLQLLHTLAASLIWGVNTLFLLDAGLSAAQAFAANACFSAGMVLFEVPTGVLADTRGRRASYLLGTLTLAVSTLLYWWMWRAHAPFWAWALSSAFIGLGFTFFSGAVEAWLVDALEHGGHFRDQGTLEQVLAKGQVVNGAAMLAGSAGGGLLAQAAGLGAPYLLRALLLALTFALAWALMHDEGFTPRRDERPMEAVRTVLRGALEHGLARPPVRWVMLSGPFVEGVGIYAFYAMQPLLLELYGDRRAYAVAGLAAAVVAGAQIAGGLLAPRLSRVFARRTSALLAGTALGAAMLGLIGWAPGFWAVGSLFLAWAVLGSALEPARQAYLNGLIPSGQRATVLSFDSLLGSGGGVAIQPLLGRAADVWGYPASFACGAALQALALPLLGLARRENAASDPTRA